MESVDESESDEAEEKFERQSAKSDELDDVKNEKLDDNSGVAMFGDLNSFRNKRDEVVDMADELMENEI
jgi:hypothetical protein